ncbi:MAG: hypothetical protein SCM11_06955 [Bacillota bacterium]|nr:hypothetical protein [Bacillota bacterium]
MTTELMRLMRQKDPDDLAAYLDSLNGEHFSLVTLVDALSPFLVMESNLRFGSFHLIKMSLFLRKLSQSGLLSQATEIALAKVVVQHLYYLEWIELSVSPFVHSPDPIDAPLDSMLKEIKKGNAHNAYFYAALALQENKSHLISTLLLNGALSIPDTLGHSLSCFFPVLEQLVDMDHPAAGTALFSYILYLCRLRTNSLSGRQPVPVSVVLDRSHLLQQAASGTSIVDVHHMITYYIFQTWEKAAWQQEIPIPWSLLADWIGTKQIDNKTDWHRTQAVQGRLPGDYEQWRQIFAKKDKENIIAITLSLLNISFQQTCDWLFRVYADYYTPDWDPHYFTSLYAALELYRDNTVDQTGSTMAVIQALSYFIFPI